MSVLAEQYIHPNAPDPTQLRLLAAVGIASAASRQGLKSPPQFPRSHYFVDSIDALAEGSDIATGPVEVYHRVAGRAGRVIGAERDMKLRRWSLKFYDVFAARGGKEWINAQTLYRFEWDEQRTLLAERKLRLVDGLSVSGLNLDDAIDKFYVPDDMAAVWHAEDEMSRVTAPECDVLIQDMRNYFALVEAQNSRG